VDECNVGESAHKSRKRAAEKNKKRVHPTEEGRGGTDGRAHPAPTLPPAITHSPRTANGRLTSISLSITSSQWALIGTESPSMR
jgi:hypothetical protein